VRHALALQANNRAGLRPSGDGQALFAVESGDSDPVSQGSLRHVDAEVEQDVVIAPLEERVALDVQDDVQVTRRPTIGAGFPLTAEADTVPVVYASGDVDRQPVLPLNALLTVALRTRSGDDFAASVAAWAGSDVDEGAKQGLLGAPHLSGAVALGAAYRRGARLRSAAAAGGAGLQARQADFLLDPKDRFLEGDLQIVPQVGAARRPRAPGGTHAKAAEEVLEYVAKAAEPPEPSAADPVRVYPGKAIVVVGGTLLVVVQDLVGLVNLLEATFRVGFFVHIWVVLSRQPAVGGANTLLVCVPRNAEHIVIVSFRGRHALDCSQGSG